MAERIIQRTVFGSQRRLQALYHRFADPMAREPEFPDRFSACLWRSSRLSSDTYFNTFFEPHWRRYTRLGGLRLRLTVTGLDQFINAQGGIEKLIPGIKLPDSAGGSTNSIDRLAGSLDRLLPGLGGAVKGRAGTLIGMLGEPAELEGKQAVSFPVRFNDGAAFFGPFPIGQTGPLY